MAKKLTHYRDTETGLYVTKAKWQRAKRRGSKRYVRSKEKYTKPTKKRGGGTLPKPIPPIPGVPGPHVVERLKYQGQDRRKFDLEIISENGKTKSVRVNGKIYTSRYDFHKLRDLVEAARGELLEDAEDETDE